MNKAQEKVEDALIEFSHSVLSEALAELREPGEEDYSNFFIESDASRNIVDYEISPENGALRLSVALLPFIEKALDEKNWNSRDYEDDSIIVRANLDL